MARKATAQPQVRFPGSPKADQYPTEERKAIMSPEERDAILAKPLDAILAIPRASGAPQLTPIWFAWENGAFYMSTTRTRAKYKLVKANPDIALCVNDAQTHHYITATGRAEVLEHDIIALTLPILRKYMPEDKAREWAANLENENRVIIMLRPEHWILR